MVLKQQNYMLLTYYLLKGDYYTYILNNGVTELGLKQWSGITVSKHRFYFRCFETLVSYHCLKMGPDHWF